MRALLWPDASVEEHWKGLDHVSGSWPSVILVAEEWARAQACQEMAADTWIDHEGSQRGHDALGFEVVDRCIHFRRQLA
jgi:aminoglycoside 6'-N-acetyltransferase I